MSESEPDYKLSQGIVRCNGGLYAQFALYYYIKDYEVLLTVTERFNKSKQPIAMKQRLAKDYLDSISGGEVRSGEEDEFLRDLNDDIK